MLTDAEKRRLSPEDLLMEERTALKIKKWRADEDEAYSQQCAVEEALESNPDLDLDRAIVRGRRVNGRSGMHYRGESHKSAMSYGDLLIAAGAGKTIQELLKQYQSLAYLFESVRATTAPAVVPAEKELVHTDLHEFDMAYVSQKTKEILEAEASVINTRVLALAGIKEASARRVEIENIQKEAARLNMVQHPETMLYVHSEARVITLEMIHNPLADARLCAHVVCVFRPIANTVDSRGIKVQVADVLDNKPSELLVSGQHLPPELKHS